MSSRSLYRWSGGTLIVSSLLLIIEIVVSNVMCPGHACTPQQEMSLPWLLVALTWLIGSVLFVIGMPGIYLPPAWRPVVLALAVFILPFFPVLLHQPAFPLF